MQYRKRYIDVVALFSQDGTIRPIEFIWGDGRKYKIQKVLDVKPRPATKAGGVGNRYTVQINGQERNMFLEYPEDPTSSIGRWFVEEPIRSKAITIAE